MAALDAKARATALKLLQKFGKPCVIYKVGEGDYDPATGDVASEALIGISTIALIEDYSGIDYMSGLVEKTDRKITIPADGVNEPNPNDRIAFDIVSYSVVSVKAIWSGEQVAIYELQGRK